MALSFTEKQYWKSRTEKIVLGKINELRCLSSNIIQEIREKADREIAAEINISDELETYRDREEQIENLKTEQKDHLSAIAVDVYGKDMPFRITLSDIERELERLAEERSDSLFSQHKLGQHLDFLGSEKTRFLDAILLATNVQQIGYIMDEAAALEPLPAVEELHVPEEPKLSLSDYSIQ